MSAWVLILYIGIGYGGGSTAIDMPSYAACTRELTRASSEMTGQNSRFGVYGFCLNREDRP